MGAFSPLAAGFVQALQGVLWPMLKPLALLRQLALTREWWEPQVQVAAGLSVYKDLDTNDEFKFGAQTQDCL